MSKVLRMRGLPFRASQDDIRGFFQTLAPQIIDISFEMGADGRPNGEALVEFISEAESEKAMAFDRQMMGHRQVNPFCLPCHFRGRGGGTRSKETHRA